MPGLTVSDVFAHVKRTFGDESGVQLTEDDIIRFINDAQREAVMQNEELLPAVTYLDLVAGQDRYPIPDNVFSVHHVYVKSAYDTQYYKLKWLSVFQMSTYIDGWDGLNLQDFPRVYSKEDDGLVLFPVPNQDVVSGLKLHAARYANDVTDSSSEIDVPAFLHTMVVNFCLSQAYEMDEDWAAAQLKTEQVQGDLNFNSHRESWYGRDSYPVISPRFSVEDWY